MKPAIRTQYGAPIERKPAWSTRPYRMSPARREHIFGQVQPMDRPKDSTAPYFIALAVGVAAYFILRSVV